MVAEQMGCCIESLIVKISRLDVQLIQAGLEAASRYLLRPTKWNMVKSTLPDIHLGIMSRHRQ
jgi:hypothetical protein